VFSIEFIHLFVLPAIPTRFGEEGCLWFLLFQEEVERKAEVFTLIAAGLTNFSNRGQGHLGLQISYVAARC